MYRHPLRIVVSSDVNDVRNDHVRVSSLELLEDITPPENSPCIPDQYDPSDSLLADGIAIINAVPNAKTLPWYESSLPKAAHEILGLHAIAHSSSIENLIDTTVEESDDLTPRFFLVAESVLIRHRPAEELAELLALDLERGGFNTTVTKEIVAGHLVEFEPN